MTQKPVKFLTLGQFNALLDACGPEPGDWPHDLHGGALALLQKDIEAKRLHAEALALTALLDSAAPAAAPPVLVSRILEAAGATVPGNPARSADVVPLRRGQYGHLLANLPHAALLAASLMLGVWAGATGFADQLVTAPLEIVGLSPQETLSERALRFDGDLGDLEEVL